MMRRSLAARFSDHRNGTTINIRAENWCCGQSATDAQFHDSIEVNLELDCPFKASRPKRLNEFGIPVKRQLSCAKMKSDVMWNGDDSHAAVLSSLYSW